MRGDGDNEKSKSRTLKKGVLTAEEAREAVKKMRETSGDSYYDVSRLEDPDRMIVFDIPDDTTTTKGGDGRDYENLVPKKIVELEGGDVIEVYHEVNLKAPTVILNALYGNEKKDPQVEEDHLYMSYSEWQPASGSRNYHKVLWASEAEGGMYERIYNSVD